MVHLKEGESRTYVVPLRRDFLKAPTWRRSKRAVSHLRSFLIKHTKTEDVRLGRWLNEEIWKHGGKNPPGQVKVEVKKDKDFVTAELVDLSARAKRIMEAEAKKTEDDKKKVPEKVEEKKEDSKKKKAPVKKTKKADKKASRKELQKELEEAKVAEEKRKTKKSKTTPTKQQEIKMRKK